MRGEWGLSVLHPNAARRVQPNRDSTGSFSRLNNILRAHRFIDYDDSVRYRVQAAGVGGKYVPRRVRFVPLARDEVFDAGGRAPGCGQ